MISPCCSFKKSDESDRILVPLFNIAKREIRTFKRANLSFALKKRAIRTKNQRENSELCVIHILVKEKTVFVKNPVEYILLNKFVVYCIFQ